MDQPELDQPELDLMSKYNNKFTLGVVFCILIFSLLYGCAGEQSKKKDLFFERWRKMAEKSRGYSPAAKKLVTGHEEKKIRAVVKKKAEIEPEKLLPTQKTTLEMHNTEVAVLIRALARAVNQDIMINENVKGRISINVKEAPWDQIFRGILRAQGLSYGWEGNIIHIITLEDKEKTLKQLETEQKIKAKKKEIEMVGYLLTRIIHIDYADAGKLKENLEKFLTEKAKGESLGSVMVDEHSNALIIQAIQSDIERMLPIIEELDKPTPQVLIEAQIVEATSDTARELGIQWGGLYQSGGDIWVVPDASTSVTPGSGGVVDPASGYAANFPVDITGAGLSLGLIAESIGSNILAVQLQALQTEGKVNILSSPSITTLDNQVAVIESGKDVPYQTVEDGDVKIEFKKVVLSLEVTPHVIDGKTLKMDIKTNKDELDWANAVGGQPAIITKKAETNVLLLDGQTTVIGGLSKEKTDASELGVPFLKDIPLLGWLFKSKSNKNEMEEVLIFITPHILKEQPSEMPISQTPEPESFPVPATE